jgi:hypothetical protein
VLDFAPPPVGNFSKDQVWGQWGNVVAIVNHAQWVCDTYPPKLRELDTGIASTRCFLDACKVLSALPVSDATAAAALAVAV